MRIKNEDPDFSCFDVYLGPDKFSKGEIIEADDGEGYILFKMEDMWGSTFSHPKKEFGKVYIVRTS